jgi:CHAD domain-containing protein
MKRKKIRGVIKSSFKKMESLSKKRFSDYAIENIHSFRIEVKKLRAFLHVIHQVQNKHAPHLPKQIKKIYQLLGQIRTHQLQRLSIRKIVKKTNAGVPKTYVGILQDETTTQIARANKLLGKKNIFRSKDLISKLPAKIPKASLNNYLSSQKNKLFVLISTKNISDEQLHQIRKILKELLYISPYIINKEKSPENLILSKANIKEITEKLGNFHDICMAINLLSPEYIDKISSGQERNSALAIREQLQKQKQETKSTVKFENYRALLN